MEVNLDLSNEPKQNSENEYYTKVLQGKKSPITKLESEEVLSVSEVLRKDSGTVKVKGMIISRTPLYKLISTYTERCTNSECNYYQELKLEKPIAAIKESKRCSNCNQNTIISSDIKYLNATTIELQDIEKFNEIERLSLILFENDTLDINIGEKVIVNGEIHIDNNVPKKGKLITRVYAHSIQYKSKEVYDLTEYDKEAIKRFTKLTGNKIIERLVQMFCPSIIGYNDVKEGLLYSAVSSGFDNKIFIKDNKKFRERIHVLLIGSPGLAKSRLLLASIKLVPNSRYESAQSSSAKSLTAIVVKEEENQYLRIGPIPQAKFAICAINEISSMNYEDQAYLLDIMEEALFTINKYGINALINSPTTIIASANPINNSKWNDAAKININEIPAIRPLIDRFDLIFTMRPVTQEKHLREYTYRKSENINNKLEPDYTQYLWKHIMYSKQFHPIITDEARSIINEFYIKLQHRSNNNFITPRTLDRLYRLVIARARLQLKNIADERDAIAVLKFYNPIVQQLGEVVCIPSNPRDIAYQECITLLEHVKEFGGITLEELFKTASENNKQVHSYFGINKPLKIERNYKTKAVYHMLLNNQNIKKINDKPIILQWISSPNIKEEDPSSLSDVSDVSEVQNLTIEKNNEFEQSGKQLNNFISDNINTDSNLDNDRDQSHIGSNKQGELNDTTTLSEGKSQSLTSIQKNFSINKNQTSDRSDTSDRKLIDKEYNNSLITVADLATGSYDPQIIHNIDRFKGTDRWFCNNCTMRGDKWFMMKHPCRKKINADNI